MACGLCVRTKVCYNADTGVTISSSGSRVKHPAQQKTETVSWQTSSGSAWTVQRIWRRSV